MNQRIVKVGPITIEQVEGQYDYSVNFKSALSDALLFGGTTLQDGTIVGLSSFQGSLFLSFGDGQKTYAVGKITGISRKFYPEVRVSNPEGTETKHHGNGFHHIVEAVKWIDNHKEGFDVGDESFMPTGNIVTKYRKL